MSTTPLDDIKLLISEAIRADRATRSTATAPATSITDLVGTFNATRRTDEELELSSMTILSKKDRENLSPSDKNKIYAHFIKGIPDKELRFKANRNKKDVTIAAAIDETSDTRNNSNKCETEETIATANANIGQANRDYYFFTGGL